MDELVVLGLVVAVLHILDIGLMVAYAARHRKNKENEHRDD